MVQDSLVDSTVAGRRIFHMEPLQEKQMTEVIKTNEQKSKAQDNNNNKKPDHSCLDYICHHTIFTLLASLRCTPTMGFPDFCFAFIFFALSYQGLTLNSQELACNLNDLVALNGFSSCIDSEIGGWNSSTTYCCTWTGVTCDNSTVLSKRVVGLELGSKRLTGTICEPLAGLDELRILNLSHNFLHGSLPTQLFQLKNLEVLDLHDNDLVGSIPKGTDLPSIQYVDISKNNFVGHFDATLCKTSPDIQILNLASNYFMGEISTSLGNCTSLQHLYLNGNNFEGSLTGSVFQLQQLRLLNLQDNSFSGPLNDGIRNLSNLVELDISLNKFSGILPDVFGSLGKLQHFFASLNYFSGLLPTSLVNSPSLSKLDLHNNTLYGPINLNCSAMINLSSLHLSFNNFHGPIPDSLSTCQRLTTLNLGHNNLSGQIPYHFKNLQALTFLGLSKTNLTNLSAVLEILQHCKNLTTLMLSENFQNEQMPINGNFQFRNLKALSVAYCELRGSIPLWLSRCNMLQFLDLSRNDLGGTIPSWFNEFNHLFYLDLSNNSFTGAIPKSLTDLPSLIDPNISSEGPSLGFPLFRTVTDGANFQYNQIWSFPPTLDLSYNKLNGEIWPSFGNLKGLHVFNLQENQLSGPIPDSLSGMTSLEILDLSHNKLSGEIPQSLVKLSFLSKFSVAYNLLYGEIPTGGQFMTFPHSSFEGNNGLCGADFIPCQPEQIPPVQAPSDRMSIVGLPFGIGASTGFVLSVSFCFISGWVFPKAGEKWKIRFSTRRNQM